MRSCSIGCLTLGLLFATVASAQDKKPPPLPPINPIGAKLAQTYEGLKGPGQAVAYNRTRGLLVTASLTPTLRCWNREQTKRLTIAETTRQLQGHSAPVLAVASGGKRLASAGVTGKVLLWDLDARKPTRTVKVDGVVRALALSPDGKQLATCSKNQIQLWNAETGQSLRKWTDGTDRVLALRFSPDGKTLAAAGYDGKLRLWRAQNGQKIADVVAGPQPPKKGPAPPPNVIWGVAFSPDGKTVVAGGEDAQLYLFQSDNGKMVRTLKGHERTISALAFHPGGTVLASASKDGTIRLWDPQRGRSYKSLTGHTAWVEDVTFVTRGTHLVSVGADRTVRLWQLAK